MNGYGTLLAKELREALRTQRLLIAAAVFLLAGISGPLLTYYLPDLLRGSVSGGIRIIVPPQTAGDAVAAYLKNILQLPVLVVVLLAMGAVADERAHGAGALILCRPVSRVAYLLAKFSGLGLVLLGGLSLGALAAYSYTLLLFGSAPLGPFLLLTVGLGATLLDVLAITLLCSTVARSSVVAGGLAFVLALLLLTVGGVWSPLARLLPLAINNHASAILAGAWSAADLPGPLAGGLGLAVLCVGVACVTLRSAD